MTITSATVSTQFYKDFDFWEGVRLKNSRQVWVTDNSGRFALRKISSLPYTQHEFSRLKQRVQGFVHLLSTNLDALETTENEKLKRVLINLNYLQETVFDRNELSNKPELKRFYQTTILEEEVTNDTHFLTSRIPRYSCHLGIDKENGKLLLRYLPCIAYSDKEVEELNRRLHNVVRHLPGGYDESTIRNLIKKLLGLDKSIFDACWITENEELISFLTPVCEGTDLFQSIVRECNKALLVGILPEETDGCSGCIIMRNTSMEPIAVFKPMSQENMSESNKRYMQQVKRIGAGVARGFGKGSVLETTGGQAYLSEITAYEVSKMLSLGLVRETQKVTFDINGVKEVGALQLFENRKFLNMKELFQFSGQCYQRGKQTIDDKYILKMLPQHLFERLVLIKWVMGDCDSHAENALVILESSPDGPWYLDEDGQLIYHSEEGIDEVLGEHLALQKMFEVNERFHVSDITAIDASWGNAPKHPELLAEQEKFILVAEKLPHGKLPFMETLSEIGDLMNKLEDLDQQMVKKYKENGQDPLLSAQRIERRQERIKVLEIFIRTNRPIKDLVLMNSESTIDKLIVRDACNPFKVDEKIVRGKLLSVAALDCAEIVEEDISIAFQVIIDYLACLNKRTQFTKQEVVDLGVISKKIEEWSLITEVNDSVDFILLKRLYLYVKSK